MDGPRLRGRCFAARLGLLRSAASGGSGSRRPRAGHRGSRAGAAFRRLFSAAGLRQRLKTRPRRFTSARTELVAPRRVGRSSGHRRADDLTNFLSVRTEPVEVPFRSEEHTSDLQSLMLTSYAVFCLQKKTNTTQDI